MLLAMINGHVFASRPGCRTVSPDFNALPYRRTSAVPVRPVYSMSMEYRVNVQLITW